MTDTPPHKSAELGAKSMLLGLLGSVIAYFGLWVESDIVGLIGWGTVSIAMIGGLTSLFWYIGMSLKNYIKSR